MESTSQFTEGKILLPLIQFTLQILAVIFLQAMYGTVDLLVVGPFRSGTGMCLRGFSPRIPPCHDAKRIISVSCANPISYFMSKVLDVTMLQIGFTSPTATVFWNTALRSVLSVLYKAIICRISKAVIEVRHIFSYNEFIISFHFEPFY